MADAVQGHWILYLSVDTHDLLHFNKVVKSPPCEWVHESCWICISRNVYSVQASVTHNKLTFISLEGDPCRWDHAQFPPQNASTAHTNCPPCRRCALIFLLCFVFNPCVYYCPLEQVPGHPHDRLIFEDANNSAAIKSAFLSTLENIGGRYLFVWLSPRHSLAFELQYQT
jgi:hypothetical protein